MTSLSTPKVSRKLPEIVSMPTDANAKPEPHRHDRLERRRAAEADEAREREEIDGEIFRRAEPQRELARPTSTET